MKPTQILIIEPDVDAQFLLADLLRCRGYEVLTFADDHEVLAYMRGQPQPRCLLLDVRVPRLDGVTLHQRLLDHSLEDIPLVMIADGSFARSPGSAAVMLRRPLRLQELYIAVDEQAALLREGGVSSRTADADEPVAAARGGETATL